MRRGIPQLALAALLVAPLWLTSRHALGEMAADRPYDVRYVPDGRNLLLLSPSIRLTIANAYWLATIQYLGDRNARQRGFEKLFPLGDLVTTLDPRHGYAYQTVGIALSSEGQLDASDRLLRKGIASGPNWWSYAFYIAFNHFFFRGDAAEAGRWAERAARTPGASERIAALAATMKVRAGSPDDAVRFLEEMQGLAKDEKTADALRENYKLALLQRDFARLDAGVALFREQHGHAPRRLEELVAAGILASIPREPFGGRYYVDDEGVVHSSAKDHRFKPQELPRDLGTRIFLQFWKPPDFTTAPQLTAPLQPTP
jgi:hypothetical protein